MDRARLQVSHRRGDARSQAALHDGRRAERNAGRGAARHRRLGAEHAHARPSRASCSAPASRSMRRKYYIIIPDALGHGEAAKPSDGLKTKFPQYDYADMVDAQYRLLTEGLGITPRAADHRQLDGRDACLAVGRELSRLHGRAGADGVAADRDGEPQLDAAADDAGDRSAAIPTTTTATTPRSRAR